MLGDTPLSVPLPSPLLQPASPVNAIAPNPAYIAHFETFCIFPSSAAGFPAEINFSLAQTQVVSYVNKPTLHVAEKPPKKPQNVEMVPKSDFSATYGAAGPELPQASDPNEKAKTEAEGAEQFTHQQFADERLISQGLLAKAY